MTTSYSLMHKMRIVKRFYFQHTKAISPQTESNFDEFPVT